MRDDNDWRLTNQLNYLRGADLCWRTYREYQPGWDHDHCEFCNAKFDATNDPATLHEGYTTTDEYRWICTQCFEDFKDLFAWNVID
ncbi:MAG TPA: hypothetical protein VJZ00_07680 [Thermoanaerobaculia bacterium]|nr:hypothetical protein [Thermoanaerobaculia bacterium]